MENTEDKNQLTPEEKDKLHKDLMKGFDDQMLHGKILTTNKELEIREKSFKAKEEDEENKLD